MRAKISIILAVFLAASAARADSYSSPALAIGVTIPGGVTNDGLYIDGGTALAQFVYGAGNFAALQIAQGVAGAPVLGLVTSTVGAIAGGGAGATGTLLSAVGPGAATSSSGNNVTAQGFTACYYNSGSQASCFGSYAGSSNTGGNFTGVGYGSGTNNTGNNFTGVGVDAGNANTADNATVVGFFAGWNNTGLDLTAVGYNAGRSNTGAYNTIIGANTSIAAATTNAVILATGQGTIRFDFGYTTAGIATFEEPIQSTGSAPTPSASGGTCAVGTVTGGADAGVFSTTGVCASTNTITLTWAAGAATKTGRVCDVQDRTTGTALITQSSDSQTTAVVKIGLVSTGGTDVIQFHCIGY